MVKKDNVSQGFINKIRLCFSSLYANNVFIDKVFEVVVMIVAMTAVITIVLIFIFVGSEALPIFYSEEVWKDASLYKLFVPQVFEGYHEPSFIWQPNSDYPKYSILPLIIGSIKVTIVAVLIGAPLAIIAAIYTSQFAGKAVREFIKPSIELLAGIPSVVLGFFCFMVMATLFQNIFGLNFRLNGFTAGIALSFAIIPIIYTITEDALNSVPKSYIAASLALGANKIQTTLRVIIPSVLPGIFAAVVLGFGRAIGETMIVLLASGNASILSADLFDSLRTMSATIAAEMGEVVQGKTHWNVLFFLGTLLFIFTFILNYIGDMVINRAKKRLSGSR